MSPIPKGPNSGQVDTEKKELSYANDQKPNLEQQQPEQDMQKAAVGDPNAGTRDVQTQEPAYKPPSFFRDSNSSKPGEPMNDVRYIANSANSTFVFSTGARASNPDGVFYASNKAQRDELEAAVAVGNLSHYDAKQKKRLTPEQAYTPSGEELKNAPNQ